MFKSVQNGGFCIDRGRLFQREEPMYENNFCPMLVFQKGAFILGLTLDNCLKTTWKYVQ